MYPYMLLVLQSLIGLGHPLANVSLSCWIYLHLLSTEGRLIGGKSITSRITWIGTKMLLGWQYVKLNFAWGPICSGFRLKIFRLRAHSLKSPCRTRSQDFYVLKKFIDLSRIWIYEFGSRDGHVTRDHRGKYKTI